MNTASSTMSRDEKEIEMNESLGFEIALDVPYEQALTRVVEGLAKEGFGVLTRIDVKETFEKKLGADFRPYVILGACNPQLAHRALSGRPEAGLLLPCNVTVEQRGEEGSLVRIIDPDGMMRAGNLDDDPVLAEVGKEARARLSRVAKALAGSS
jgi:uncharacterized protein (DUF302 family)